RDEGPFLQEERALIDSVARQVARIVEAKRFEHSLRAANRKLASSNQQLTATEQQLRAYNEQLEADVRDRRLTQEALQRRLAYETIIADITSLAVQADDLERLQEQCVAKLGEVAGVSRVYVFEHHEALNAMSNTYEWCAPGIEPQKDELQNVPGSAIPWWVETLRRGDLICYSDIEQIPDEGTKEILRPQDIQSILVVPLFVDGRYYGFLGLDDCAKHRDWPEEDIGILTSISRILTAVIGRTRTERALAGRRDELERAQQLLRLERDRLHAVMQTAPVAMLMIDADERVIEINRAAEQIFRHDPIAPHDRPYYGDVIGCVERHGEDGCGERPRCSSCATRAAIRYAMARGTVEDVEVEVAVEVAVDAGRDGAVRQLLLSAAPLRFGDQPGVIIVANDITEMRALHAQMAQADRLSSMGMLAAGVAHEVNNPLSFVLYNLESLCEDLPELLDGVREVLASSYGSDTKQLAAAAERLAQRMSPTALDDLRERFDDALSGTRRIRKIARGLGTFSRVEKDESDPVRLTDVIELALNMSFNEIKYRARLVKDYGKTPAILASSGRLSQVFLNLIINAAHAIEEGDVASNEIRVTTWCDERHVYAEVQDTGCGIAPDDLPKLFEPFFSTKEVGRGSGLGLAISKSIVEGYGGAISVESEVGKGTKFLVRLPTRIGTAAEAGATSKTRALATQGRILIVDDEDQLRAAMVRMLRGHDTVQAASSAEATRILERDRKFDVILCDVMMPEGSGMDLHRWLLESDPALAERVIFITGGAFTPHARAYLRNVDNLRLEKPFDVTAFRKIVNDRIKLIRAGGG
ncbi:MAG: ATP-binding protein, partial [Myxococcota bacterium]